MPQHHQINYVELPCRDLAANQAFFSAVFDWQFIDYGPDYCAFAEAGLDGGFYRAEHTSDASQGAALVVLYSHDLEASLQAVQQHGGQIKKAIFSFPGGRRFHFTDPSGNEWAVWSAVAAAE